MAAEALAFRVKRGVAPAHVPWARAITLATPAATRNGNKDSRRHRGPPGRVDVQRTGEDPLQDPVSTTGMEPRPVALNERLSYRQLLLAAVGCAA